MESTPVAACRNCNARITGEYCAQCGQETRLELPTARLFVREAAGRYVALDGRLWRTLFALVARPGFLTLEYFAGRRRRYIRPARLFLVSSLLLFAVIGLLRTPADIGSDLVRIDEDVKKDAAARGENPQKQDTDGAAATPPASATEGKAEGERGTRIGIGVSDDMDPIFTIDGRDIMPEAIKERRARFQKLSPEQKAEQVYSGLLRFGPYAMVALLPAFALLLQIAYLGRGKRYPGRPRRYAEHLVYSAHLHAFIALALVLMIAIPWSWIEWVLGLWIVYYVLRARRVVYRGSWWGAILRGAFIVLAYTVLISLAVAALLIAAILLR